MATTLKLGGKEYTIKFANKVTVKSGALKEVTKIQSLFDSDEPMLDALGEMYFSMAKLLLVGLQKFHSDEFGYDPNTNEGYDEKFDKTLDLLEDYFDNDDADFLALFTSIQEELLANGFLASILRQMEAEEKKSKK